MKRDWQVATDGLLVGKAINSSDSPPGQRTHFSDKPTFRRSDHPFGLSARSRSLSDRLPGFRGRLPKRTASIVAQSHGPKRQNRNVTTDPNDRYVRIDPRDFINPPFISCPKCGQNEYGILSIYDHGFSRRCRACWFTSHAELPPIRKTLVYLDQFAISNLMFADTKAGVERGLNKSVDPFWHLLFAKLNGLLILQLVVCPQSSAHDRESILSRHHLSLRQTFEALSLGVFFYDFETIKRFQLSEHLQHWLRGQHNRISEITARRVLHSDPHVWTDRFLITVDLGQVPGYVEAVRAEREAVYEAFSGVFQRWKENSHVPWEQWFEEEALDYGPSILKTYLRDLGKLREVHGSRRPLSEDDVFPTQSQKLVSLLLLEIRDAGVAEDQVWPRLFEFLHSPSLKLVPFNRISAALYASVAKKAPHQNKLPTKGFFIDVDVISCLLPYCNAMFLDVECWSYLRELKRSGKLSYGARVFSLRNKDEFADYLEGLAAGLSSEHHRLVREIYGL